jgi:hypothetical protein
MSGRGEGVGVLLVLAGFAALCVWIVLRMSHGGQYYPAASSYSPKPDGAKALYELLAQAGLSVKRYGDTEFEYPQLACVLSIEENPVDASQMMFSQVDVKALAVWLKQGGRLVLAGAPSGGQYGPLEPTAQTLIDYLDGKPVKSGSMFDTPPPRNNSPKPAAAAADAPAPLAVAKFKGKGQSGNAMAMLRSYQPGFRFTLGQPQPRLFGGISEIEVAEGIAVAQSSAVPLLSAGDPPLPVVLFRQVGQGELYWVTRPELFANSWLARADNHRLVLALLAYAARDRKLYIDEHVHGYARERANAGSLLFKTTGGKLILGGGLALALCFLGAAVRPARCQPQPPPPRRTSTEMVLAQAGLYRRAGALQGIAGHLVDGVRRAYMHEYALGWAQSYAQSGVLHAQQLLDYLQAGSGPGGQAGLARLARACDWARIMLTQERRG